MRPPDLFRRYCSSPLVLFVAVGAEVCPIERPTESPSTATSSGEASAGPVKRLLLKPKSCPDFKDDADQNQCCPSRITFGSFYCCTLAQKHEIQSEIAAERRKAFVKKYLAVIVIVAIGLSILSIVIASMICKRVRFCPLHHSKGAYLHSRGSFQMPSSHTARAYRPVEQQPPAVPTRHSATFAPAAQPNKPPSAFEAPPPYESHEAYRPIGGAQVQHQYNRVLENEFNSALERHSPTTDEMNSD
ncbi:hypothetical protein M3Y99_01888300 [Aphelenchoides fujianensis]|nr:hypothetical protein M3Y99_01888300 [Aphelenchoides fujianensis]